MSKPSSSFLRRRLSDGNPAVTSSSKRHSTMIIGFLRASMAFTYHRFFTSKSFSNLISRLGLVLTFCLRRRRRRPDRDDGAESSSDDTVLIMDGSCPMLVPIHVVTSMIKSRIPVVEFGEYVDRRRRRRGLDNNGGEDGEEPSSCCAVCLGTIEWGHVIREPSNCDHVFHRECLDRWIGEHRVTCPLCRCIMLPARRNITFC